MVIGSAIRVAHHYKHLAESQFRRHMAEASEVKFKKYFYVLRPVLALRWIRLHPDVTPPMNLQALVAELDLDTAVIAAIAELLRIKAAADEAASGERIAVLDALISNELEWANGVQAKRSGPPRKMEADDLFRDIIKGVTND